MSYRAAKAGLARDTQVKIDSQFDIDEAKKCLYWLGEMTGENVEIQETDDRREMADSFHTTLKDGSLLCRLIDAVLPEGQKIDFSKKSFQESKNQAFTMARERERIAIFINKCQEYGAQSRPGYAAPVIWPKKNETNVRTFSEEQVQAGKQVISLQYGSNKGANQAGMSFGKTRMILD
ncbi:MYPH-like protein [Mya arenaria]|uniref:MYPH-like protein n=1 Tax=Mya arenaria TaxID=6604 RepID=A0ABY7EEB7_MYAAR|nr:MYPH-like protein [Mya arenaria]